MAQLEYTRLEVQKLKLGRREQLLLLEIDRDSIDTASSFVNYMFEEYGFSKSSVWYNLNRLKDLGVVEFASKEDVGKPLALTRQGLQELAHLERHRNELVNYFSNVMIEKENAAASRSRRPGAYYTDQIYKRSIQFTY